PGQLAQIVRLTADGADIALQTLGDECDGAVLVDQSPGDHR
ncbi:MAG TPA: alpha/beta hydrolase, partial [Mycobacterium sp.]